jgi:Tfp pilus assembly protein PilE
MLVRISLIVALLAGIAVGVLNFIYVKEKITTLQTHLKEQTDRADKAEKERDQTKRELAKTQTELKQTQVTLKTTTEERDTALANAAAQQKRADGLATDLAKTKQERDDAQAEVASYRATGMKPDEIINANKTIHGLQDALAGSQDENHLIGKKLAKVQSELDFIKNPERHVELPSNLKGKVLVSDPKWQFVVLNVGEDQGVKAHGELLINRDGKLVAKVRVTSMQRDRCVANVEPGWQLGEILEGDQVIPAYPAS